MTLISFQKAEKVTDIISPENTIIFFAGIRTDLGGRTFVEASHEKAKSAIEKNGVAAFK